MVLSACLWSLDAISATVVAEPAVPIEAQSRSAVRSLGTELAKGELWGEPLAGQGFARAALTKEDAAKSREMLWQRHAARITKERDAEIREGLLKLDKHAMPFFLTTFGAQPKEGWSLWISMHGGGGAPKFVNDQQWENQKRLYRLQEGVYVAPRAPTDSWNLWHEAHIDDLFDRLIEDLIVLKHVNPDRVYLMGYSAGGDGVYQLAPRMADRWAAAAMMAGHPNDASWLGLRNLGFAIQVGERDAAYNRNKVAQQWIDKLDELQRQDPKGYVHFAKVHKNKGHWMDREDAKVLPWMAALRRNPVPDRIVWKQSPVTHDRLYWLAVPKNDPSLAGAEAVVQRAGQTIEIKSVAKIDDLLIRLDERMVDLDQPVRVLYQDRVLFDGRVPRTIATLVHTLDQRGDPQLMFDAEVKVQLPHGK